MQLHFGIDALTPEWNASVVCIGTFDGVHLGHRELIRRAVAYARELQAPAIVLTFDRHPAAILAPDRCPKAVSSLESRLERFAAEQVDMAVILAFDAALAAMSADTFLTHILLRKLRATHLMVGHDFAMGHNREGSPEWLASRIPTHVMEPYLLDRQRVSSSAVRKAVSEGRIEDASRLLGHPFEVSGIVIEGQKLGRTLGYPTLNLARAVDQVTPADGVYAGKCATPFGIFKAAVSIGVRPTIESMESTIEAYLLDYSGSSLYGRHIRLSLQSRLRDQAKFESLEALRAQISADVEAAAKLP